MSGLIRAGQLDRRVTILRQCPPTHDGLQNLPGAFTPIGKRAASVKPTPGRESVEHLIKEGRAPATVWLRFDALTRTITEHDAIEIDGKRHQIVAPPVEVGRREGIELVTIAGTAEA